VHSKVRAVCSTLLIAPCVAVLSGSFALTTPVAGAAVPHGVRPSASVRMADVHCTVGLLMHQGKTVYAAVPASCGASPVDAGKPQWGCGFNPHRPTAYSVPVGSTARIAGAEHRAIVVYDSFTRMQVTGVKKVNKCQFNDLILLRLSKADAKSARARIPGGSAPKAISRHAPGSGTALRLGTKSATAAAGTHHGWVFPLSKAPVVTQSDLGTPLAHGGTLVGMLTALPQGTIMKTPAAAYNIYRAITFARHSPGFHHLKLLKAGQQV
jgi:hypothetical protein